MALNPFQEGQQFSTLQRGRQNDNAIGALRLEGIKALGEEFGPTALAPAERSTVTASNRADEELDDKQRIQDQKDMVAATSGVVNFLEDGLKRGIPIEDLTAKIAPIVAQLGFTPEDIAGLPALVAEDPSIIGDFRLALDGLKNSLDRKAIGRPLAVLDADGNSMLLQTFSDGSTDIVDGLRADDRLAQGRLNVSQQNVDVKQPEVQGEIAEARAVGTGRGNIRVEDLPPSQRGTANGKLALEADQQRSQLIVSTIDTAIEQADAWTAGFGSLSGFVPGTPAANLKNTLATIKANIGFNELQRLRDNSKTGGALGQVSELENLLLQSVQGALEESQSPEQLRTNLRALKVQQILSGQRIAAAFEADFGTVYGGPGTQIPENIRRFNPDTGQLE